MAGLLRTQSPLRLTPFSQMLVPRPPSLPCPPSLVRSLALCAENRGSGLDEKVGEAAHLRDAGPGVGGTL